METKATELKIEEYIMLYKSGIPLTKIKSLRNQTYAVLSNSSSRAKIVDRKEVYKNPNAFQKIKHFVKNNEHFYMIPIETIKESIVGFIIRGIFSHDYVTISRTFNDPSHQVRLMYGFNSRFKKYEDGKKCYPIVICEGCKDCLTLKKIYPYVLANNTSNMGINAYVLRNISDRFLLAYDNDSAGFDGTKKDKELLRSMGAFVDNLILPEGIKDCTDFIYTKYGDFNNNNFILLKNQLTRKLKQLYNL